jgi:hypothetical protein
MADINAVEQAAARIPAHPRSMVIDAQTSAWRHRLETRIGHIEATPAPKSLRIRYALEPDGDEIDDLAGLWLPNVNCRGQKRRCWGALDILAKLPAVLTPYVTFWRQSDHTDVARVAGGHRCLVSKRRSIRRAMVRRLVR